MTEQKLLEYLKQNPFVLAPMAGITDKAFRTLMREMGCGVVITELVSATGLKYESQKTYQLMEFDEVQRPLGIQLFGESPEIIAEGAKKSQDFGADFIDLNFGCPVPKVVKKGAGAAVLKDPQALAEILRKVKAAITIPLTIKIRTGWDQDSRNASEVVNIAASEGVTWVTIHGRTRAQGYTGFADWDFIKTIKQNAKIPVIGNGDIHSAAQAVDRLHVSGCDAVMIGRGCLKNPYIFSQANSLWKAQQPQNKKRPYTEILASLSEGLERSYDQRLVKIQLRKFAMWFSAGFPDSSQFRKEIFTEDELPRLKTSIESYFFRVQNLPMRDTSSEAFLMGGHG